MSILALVKPSHDLSCLLFRSLDLFLTPSCVRRGTGGAPDPMRWGGGGHGGLYLLTLHCQHQIRAGDSVRIKKVIKTTTIYNNGI